MPFEVCQRCVMDKSASEISFDEKGICNFCREFDKQEVKRKYEATNLPWVYHQIRKAGEEKEYDCLLGLSGGVDSSLVLHYLVENGIRPYCFSLDNGWNDKKADENIMRLVETLKVPFFRYVIDIDKFRELQIAFIRAGVKNIEIPTDHVLMAASYEVADKIGTKYIIGGGNLATEGIMPPSYGYQARDLTHIKAIYKKTVGKKLTGLPLISLLKYLYYRFIKKITVVNLLDYYDYNREAAKKLLSEKYGWLDYGEKHCENVFTSWFQNFYLPTKFGLDKRKPHFSSLINSKQMTRKEAMAQLLERPIYPELGFEKKAMEFPKHEHSDYPTSKFWWDLLSKAYGLCKGRK